jgi:hypothetical protein
VKYARLRLALAHRTPASLRPVYALVHSGYRLTVARGLPFTCMKPGAFPRTPIQGLHRPFHLNSRSAWLYVARKRGYLPRIYPQLRDALRYEGTMLP